MSKLLKYTVLVVGLVLFAYPFAWMISGSLKPELEISSLDLWSSNFSLKSYDQVVTKVPIVRAFLNSIIVSASVTASVLLFGSMVGYALSRLKFFGREALYILILFTMTVPFQVTLIPQYILMVKLGWTDSYLGLIAPFTMSAFSVVLFRQFFMGVPQSLIDAARVDGYSDLRILFRIIWPLSRPILITVGILTFMTSWNEVLWPLMIVRERTLMTMPQLVTIFVIGGEAESQLGALLAAATLLALPVIVAYSFFQRYFVESIASTGLKG
ncbi:MAG: carbohydrate ABC transporter permease [Bacteroidota bacterium]